MVSWGSSAAGASAVLGAFLTWLVATPTELAYPPCPAACEEKDAVDWALCTSTSVAAVWGILGTIAALAGVPLFTLLIKFWAFFNARWDAAARAWYAERELRVRLTNASDSALRLELPPVATSGTCRTSFTELLPGEGGTVFFVGHGSYAGAVQLDLVQRECTGDDSNASAPGQRLFLGATRSHLWGSRSGLQICEGFRGGAKAFMRKLPRQFLAAKKPVEPIVGPGIVAVASEAVQGPCSEILVLLISSSPSVETPAAEASSKLGKGAQLMLKIEALDAVARQTLADKCRELDPGHLGNAALLTEVSAVRAGLKEAAPEERAYALDLLVLAFVESGATPCNLEALGSSLRNWQQARAHLGLRLPGEGRDAVPPEAGDFAKVLAGRSAVEAYQDAAHCLLRCAALQSAVALAPRAAALLEAAKQSRDSQAEVAQSAGRNADAADARISERAHVCEDNDALMHEHLTGAAGDVGRRGTIGVTTAITVLRAAARFKSGVARARGDAVADKSADSTLKWLVRCCVHTSADLAKRRDAMIKALEAKQTAAVARKLRCYREHMCLSRRVFNLMVGGGCPQVQCQSLCSEVFQHLDPSTETDQVLRSLGHRSPEYQSLSTNSKSGEFFFFSCDRRFLVKTITEAEGRLLHRMLPAYMEHIRRNPSSLIVRYAGLFVLQETGATPRYFSVMASIFDPAYKIDETFDLKGSIYHRHKKAGDSIGKDVDWLKQGTRLNVSASSRRELLAVHEMDAGLLLRFGVMDYSLLVGIHRTKGDASLGGLFRSRPDSSTSAAGSRLRSQTGQEIYFIGLIDFLIAYGGKKQAEHLVRVLQGHSEDTSCVDPRSYAMRQVRFLRDAVFQGLLPEHDAGVSGLLRIRVVCAYNLRLVTSALQSPGPYVAASLGLQRVRTPSADSRENPEWNYTINLPINVEHLSTVLELAVWAGDSKSLEATHTRLGMIQVHMDRLQALQSTSVREPLLGADRGELVVHLTFLAG